MAQDQLALVGAVRWYRDHHSVDHLGLEQADYRPLHQGAPVEMKEGLRNTGG
jgi:hypothetical protein